MRTATPVCVTALLSLQLSLTTSAIAQNVDLPGIVIYSTTPVLPSEVGNTINAAGASTAVADPASPARPPSTGDSGEFFRHVTGVDAGRQGGHGLEPVIRGLDQNQLAITNDGAYQFGGCPNRMDPPTSHMQLYTFDRVIVKRGYQSVLDGPPAPGGSIQFERLNPTFEPGPEPSINVKAGAGYNSNGSGREAFVDMSIGNDWGYVRGFGSYAAAGNYEDGDGTEIRSSFEQFGGGLILGRTFDATSWITFKIETNNVDDALFPGSGMDAPVTDDWAYQIKGETNLDWGLIRGVKGDVYLSEVDHTMNNFSLRPNMSRHREARMESDTLGGKLVFNGLAGTTVFDIGADYRDVMRDGNRYDYGPGGTQPERIQSINWPGTSIREIGLFGETTTPLTDTTDLVAGLRLDFVHATADRADQRAAPGMMLGNNLSPNDLYRQFYGITAEDRNETNLSGLLRLEQDLGSGLEVFAAVSRSVRTADATERFMGSYMIMMGQNRSWIGNPGLDPEKHHQIEVGAHYHGTDFHISGSAFHNRVEDFIQLDTARGQRSVLVTAPTASVFTNIDATLTGFEAEAEWRLAEHWRFNLSGAYTRGQNLSDNIPLSQIAPLTGRLEIAYDTRDWMLGARLNAASSQNRVDDDPAAGSGRDFGPSEAYLTVDLFGSYNLTENFQVTAGVTNLFDETYANHLNKRDGFNNEVRVNEPGRSFYVRSVSNF